MVCSRCMCGYEGRQQYKRGGTSWDRHKEAAEDIFRRAEMKNGGQTILRKGEEDRAEQEKGQEVHAAAAQGTI